MPIAALMLPYRPVSSSMTQASVITRDAVIAMRDLQCNTESEPQLDDTAFYYSDETHYQELRSADMMSCVR